MDDKKLQAIVEALLFVSDRPLSMGQMQEALRQDSPRISAQEVQAALGALKEFYDASGRSFQIAEVAAGFQLKTLPQYAPYLATLLKDDLRDRLSIPSLETLAIIAYKQPVTRAQVEAIRGVNIDGIVNTLLEKDLIRTVGKKDIPGRPFLYGTTREFLLHFGLRGLNELPNMDEFKEALVAREKQLDQQRAAAGAPEEAHETT